MKNLYLGTSGYNYKHWRERFYPKELSVKDWLKFYSEHFNSVEINATFYSSFRKEVYEKWKDTTPINFSFTIKGSRFITHIKRLNEVDEPLTNFYESSEGLGKKLSMVLWQFPRSFKNNNETFLRLNKFLKLIKGRNAFEFRDPSWFNDSVYQLLKESNFSWVINSSGVLPKQIEVTSDYLYFRFHGPKRLYTSDYSENELNSWAELIKKEAKEKDVYCYFNNDSRAFAIKNALMLRKMLAS